MGTDFVTSVSIHTSQGKSSFVMLQNFSCLKNRFSLTLATGESYITWNTRILKLLEFDDVSEHSALPSQQNNTLLKQLRNSNKSHAQS